MSPSSRTRSFFLPLRMSLRLTLILLSLPDLSLRVMTTPPFLGAFGQSAGVGDGLEEGGPFRKLEFDGPGPGDPAHDEHL